MTDLKQNTNPERPAFLIRTKSLREILSDLRKAELWLMTAAFAAFSGLSLLRSEIFCRR